MKFRKKPVVIEAIQWTGDNLNEIAGAFPDMSYDARERAQGTLKILTLEGDMIASVGDWIIRGIKGEHYPCKPDIFEATYQRADAGSFCGCPMCEHHTSAAEYRKPAPMPMPGEPERRS